MAIYSFYSWLLPTLAEVMKSTHVVMKPMRQAPLPLKTGGWENDGQHRDPLCGLYGLLKVKMWAQYFSYSYHICQSWKKGKAHGIDLAGLQIVTCGTHDSPLSLDKASP
jgi:hypothetical protein